MDDELRKKLIELLKDKRLLEVIKHLRKANVDYGKSIILNTKIPIQEVVELLDQLEMLGLIERVHGATVKNTEAKFKLSKEVHKHHTYYTLTREGDHLLRQLNEEELIRAYIDLVKNDQFALNILKIANEVKIDHALTYTKLTHRRLEEVTPKLEELERMGLLEEAQAKIIKFSERRSKPKKETRTHHKYYALSRMGELAVRELKRHGVIPR